MANIKINTFNDWVDYFYAWQKDIGLDPSYTKDFKFEAKLGEQESNEIEFGDFKGQRKWETVMQIPDQRVRDAVLNMIVYQGDTEFASVEQQRFLFDKAPSEYDLYSLSRVMAEEMRHGWQMCYLLVNYFGDTGKIEARKELERRSWKHNRLLGSFNEDVENWLDFFVYTQFVDRDGKFQLKMLSRSSFAPLGQSMGPMLKEESYHLGTGNSGLLRIVKQNRIPISLVQKYFNKWIPTAYDLFGKDHSSTAHWAYVWGIKGRFDEGETDEVANKEMLNERSRLQYFQEVVGLIEALNKHVPEDQPKLYAPDMKFNRAIGDHAGQCWTVDGNRTLTPEEYKNYKLQVLPTPEDNVRLNSILKEKDWLQPKQK
jgi:benzoyl-CoA 2,3-dioxygenase component B